MLIGKTVKVHGKGSVDHLKPLTDKDYNIQELINMGFILESAKKFTKFSQVLTNKTLLE